jgi:hypothetical protein
MDYDTSNSLLVIGGISDSSNVVATDDSGIIILYDSSLAITWKKEYSLTTSIKGVAALKFQSGASNLLAFFGVISSPTDTLIAVITASSGVISTYF